MYHMPEHKDILHAICVFRRIFTTKFRNLKTLTDWPVYKVCVHYQGENKCFITEMIVHDNMC
jgi:hypothetical protein